MQKIVPFIILLIFTCVSGQLFGQSCFNVNAGNDTTISCLQTCLTLKARIPDVKTSDDYSVVPIAYQPFPYINPGGVIFNPTYIDDDFTDVITLPFTFCFYGRTYNQCVVGTNGILTFDLFNANSYNSWILNLGSFQNPGPPQPIPYPAGGAPNQPDSAYYPRACIMGPYHDIDPEVTQPQPANRRMEYIVVGNAPCRKFVLNFYRIPYYMCPNAIITQQMVLYEGTGIIDIFLENKPLGCSQTTNEGRAILGVQNWERDKARWVPDRNNTIWSAVKEGWRFVPNGNTSLFSRVELYKNNTLISTDTAINLGTGELEATFPNICQSEDSMSYEIKAFYQQCDNPALETEGSDTMIVYKTLSTITSNIIQPLCNGNTGTITVTAPVAPNIEYSIDGGTTWQSSTIFIRPAGNYTILARGVGTLCTATSTADIMQPAALNAAASNNNTTCAGNDGAIVITANGGTPPLQYSIDNGVTFQNSNIFPVNPGNYNNIIIQDANGCSKATAATVILNDQMFLSLGNDTTICAEQSVALNAQTNTETNMFKWTPALGLNNDAIKNPVATPADTIRYTVTANWGICQRTEDILIKVLRKPVVFAGNDTAICFNTIALLNGGAINLSGSVKYAWSPSFRVSPFSGPVATARPDSTQLYTLTVTDNYGCKFSVKDEVLVSVRPPVVAFAGNDTIAILGIPQQMAGSGGTNYFWSPSAGLNNAFAQNPVATLFTDSYFSLLVKDDIGCSDTDDIFIKVYKGPAYYVPNAFTPNGDGVNDVFRPIPVGIAQTDYFAVYNRYGELVFKTNQFLKGWDGIYKGKTAAAGTYVWMIKGTDKYGKVIEMKGTVILVH